MGRMADLIEARRRFLAMPSRADWAGRPVSEAEWKKMVDLATIMVIEIWTEKGPPKKKEVRHEFMGSH